MARWIFIRHGESVANAADRLAGHLDSPLSPRGQEQARALAHTLDRVPIQRIISSSLSRAVHTAVIAAGHRGVPVERVSSLRERSMGAWEGVSREQLRKDGRMERVLLSWTLAPPRGESNLGVATRALDWLVHHATPDDTLLVAHGGVLRSLIGLIDGKDVDAFLRDDVPNAVPIVRHLDADAWRRARARCNLTR